jgi:two-component system sensor histidine kinase HupT/HoxJ
VHAGSPAAELAALRAELRIDRALEDMGPLVEGTVEGAERTRDIVDGLKRFSAVDREGDGPIDLVPVLARAIHWVEKGAAGGRSVGRTLPASLPVTGSAAQLQQVFMNLVQNALDACAARPDAGVEVAARAAGAEAVVEVRDQGTGIDPAHLPRIFDPFFTTKPPGKGTGLGLAISYGIVQRHGGALTAANRPGGGAVFTVTLPLRR